jgi:hypothetical protein
MISNQTLALAATGFAVPVVSALADSAQYVVAHIVTAHQSGEHLRNAALNMPSGLPRVDTVLKA